MRRLALLCALLATLALHSTALASITLNTIRTSTMRSGPTAGAPCLDIWVSGLSFISDGGHPYTFSGTVTYEKDTSLYSAPFSISAFMLFETGRDELIQIPLSILHPEPFDFDVTIRGRLTVERTTSNQKGTYLPTPVILVPGIDIFNLEGRTKTTEWPMLNKLLTDTRHTTEGIYNDEYGGMRLSTMATLIYKRNRDSFFRGSQKMAELIDPILQKSHFKRVLVLAHSKGSLVTRKYMATHGDKVKAAFLVQGPHAGSLSAAADMPDGLDLPESVYGNLYPIDHFILDGPYFRRYPNSELNVLNQVPFPDQTDVWLGATNGFVTAQFAEKDSSTTFDRTADDWTFTTEGDTVVTTWSAIGWAHMKVTATTYGYAAMPIFNMFTFGNLHRNIVDIPTHHGNTMNNISSHALFNTFLTYGGVPRA